MGKQAERVTVTIDPAVKKQLEDLIQRGIYASMSHAFQRAYVLLIEEQEAFEEFQKQRRDRERPGAHSPVDDDRHSRRE